MVVLSWLYRQTRNLFILFIPQENRGAGALRFFLCGSERDNGFLKDALIWKSNVNSKEKSCTNLTNLAMCANNL
jgi:hypothetical protein